MNGYEERPRFIVKRTCDPAHLRFQPLVDAAQGDVHVADAVALLDEADRDRSGDAVGRRLVCVQDTIEALGVRAVLSEQRACEHVAEEQHDADDLARLHTAWDDPLGKVSCVRSKRPDRPRLQGVHVLLECRVRLRENLALGHPPQQTRLPDTARPFVAQRTAVCPQMRHQLARQGFRGFAWGSGDPGVRTNFHPGHHCVVGLTEGSRTVGRWPGGLPRHPSQRRPLGAGRGSLGQHSVRPVSGSLPLRFRVARILSLANPLGARRDRRAPGPEPPRVPRNSRGPSVGRGMARASSADAGHSDRRRPLAAGSRRSACPALLTATAQRAPSPSPLPSALRRRRTRRGPAGPGDPARPS